MGLFRQNGGRGDQNLCLTSNRCIVLISIMKTANIADLRNNFRMIASWISDGESFEIKKRGHHFATLIPSARAESRPMPKIDFAGRLKKIWGDRVFSDQEVAEMHMAELEGD
jgi:antitoxin (DNA-binding transcriptional repressor) of toxin-antitoxin stability system